MTVRIHIHRRALIAVAASPLMARADSRVLSFGVVPQQSAVELAKGWIPLLQLVAQRAQVGLRFVTATDIPTFERRLLAGEYDMAYMNPYHYTVFSQKPGYQAFAKEKGRRLRGLVVVRKESPLRAMADLSGHEIVFPAPAAFAATVLVRAELARQNVPVTARFVNSHESVYLNVARGLFPAGGGIERTFQAMDASVRDQLRVVWRTRDYTPHALAAHPRVPAAAVTAVRNAMLGLDGDADGRNALQGITFNGVDGATDAEWADVRSLGIQTLAELLRA